MKNIHQTLLAIFQAEHAEHLEQIRSTLALMENVSEADNKAKLDDIFRRAHTLKGSARCVDLGMVEGLAKGLESVFSRVREGSLKLDRQVTGVIHRVLESSEDCVAALRENRVPEEPTSVLQEMDRLLGILSLPPVETAPLPIPLPALVPDPPAKPVAQPIDMIRLPGENLDRLIRSTGQILTGSLQQKAVTTQLVELGRQIAGIESEWSRFRASSATPLRRLARTPEFSSITRYIEFVEQKVHSLASQTRKVRFLQQRSAWNMHTSAEELQRDVWTARLAPVEDLFEGFRKMVRDLAHDEEKEIEFRLTGIGVRADRAVLQALKDPVMHLLRNAISHGIETPMERQRKGKPATGILTVRITSEKGRLIVEIDDDGRGLDLKSVAEVAVAEGIHSEEEIAGWAPQDLERLIFRPGFSTAPTVNDLSGRGMGLSVVDETVRRLQGEVNLRQKQGPGASIVLSVPLSVSNCHLLLVSVQGQTFGIPMHGIERLHRLKAQQVETVEGKPVVQVSGRQVSLFSLARLLHIGEGPAVLEGVLSVMVLRSGSKQVAVLVDEFLAGREALIQGLGFPPPPSGMVVGGVLLREGTVVVVLNPASLIENSAPSITSASWSAKPAAPKKVSSILVVDDSVTARSLEKYILEANGYRVRVAVDGEEGLKLARAEKPDLIISDIQMPRLDGFGLLAALKDDENLKSIPVIIISSLERAEEQKRGMDLGARAYVVKRKFDQQELLDAIRQIL